MGCGCCKCSKKKKKKENSLPVIASSSSQAIQIILTEEPVDMSIEEIEEHSKDIRNIYTYAVETVTHYLGKPCYPYITPRNQLYSYISFLREDLDDDECITIRQLLSEKKMPNVQLTVVIKDAKVIHPKITEFSRIFCKLRISNGREQLTSVKDSSSYLLWDETFVLDVSDYESDVFHVEVWSSRPKLMEKLTNFSFKNSFKEDDPLAEEKGLYFIGDAMEYVKSLPCVGKEMLWPLKKGPRRIYTKGQLNIYIQIGTKKGSDSLLQLHCHMAIMRECYGRELYAEQDSNKLWKNWLEILPNEAITLIQQHALQHGITPMEQCLCSWLVTSSLKMREEDRISFYLLRDLLGHLLANINEDEIGKMKEALFKSLSDFSLYTLDMLKDLHKNFDIFNTQMADELYYMLRCMDTAEVKLCTTFMDSFEIIETEASEWYLKVIRDAKRSLEADDCIEEMCEGLKGIMKTLLKNQILLDDIFLRAWTIRYSCMTYKKLDEVVCTTIEPMIKHLMVMAEHTVTKRKTSESLQLLQLYHNVRNVVNYTKSNIPSQAILQMNDYSSWFGKEIVLEWFTLCDNYTSPFIQRAVLADSMERLGPNICHSTSVPDVATIIDEMVIEVWMKLNWEEQFHTYGALVEATKSCVLVYSTQILERINHERFFCRSKEFEVSDKLCVALSNVFAISEHLQKTNKKIKKELKVAESALGFELPDPLVNIQSHMELLTAKMFLLVSRKINDRVKNFIKQSVKKKEVTMPGSEFLCSYIDDTLDIMYANLKREPFYVVLRHLWIVILQALKDGFKHSEGCFVTKKRKIKIYIIILETFKQMKTIFFCDSHGLTSDEMENRMAEELKSNLEDRLGARYS